MTEAWIGGEALSDTTTEADGLVIDRDFEGTGIHVVVRILAVSIPAPSLVFVAVSARPPYAPRHVNVAIDVNRDQRFGGGPYPEWVVRNAPVDWSHAVTLPNGTRRVWVASPWFHFSSDLTLGPRWTRITLSPEPVRVLPGREWDGSGPPGGFTDGETEDHLVGWRREGEGPKDCVMKWWTQQPLGADSNYLVRMVGGRGDFALRVRRVAGDCPDLPPPAPPASNYQLFYDPATCVPQVGKPVMLGIAPAAPVWGHTGPPAPAPPPGAPPPNATFHPTTATWQCDQPPCRAFCPVTLVHDPDGEMVVQTIGVTFTDDEAPGALCGNQRIEEGEACDDGNLEEDDGCSSLCRHTVPGTCGDGVVDEGEECDAGREPVRGCSPSCLRVRAGGGG